MVGRERRGALGLDHGQTGQTIDEADSKQLDEGLAEG
jgi:hypothetical protein